jgi:hypothetical protein
MSCFNIDISFISLAVYYSALFLEEASGFGSFCRSYALNIQSIANNLMSFLPMARELYLLVS